MEGLREYTTSSPAFSDKINIVETTDPAHADNINAATKQLLENTLKLREENEIILQIANRTYEGRDLTHIFADEISNYSDEWAWINDLRKLNMLKGIHVMDYIPLTVDGYNYKMHIAGIGTYDALSEYKTLGIDFISDLLYPEEVIWNKNGSNNAHSYENENEEIMMTNPFCDSDIYKWLNNNLYNKLPDVLKKQLSFKNAYWESRNVYYEGESDIIDSDGTVLAKAKLWLPTEYEIFGSTIYGTKGYSAGINSQQYPIFSLYPIFIRKCVAGKNIYPGWWLQTAVSGSNTKICHMEKDGINNREAFRNSHVPICFSIGYPVL